MVIVHGLKGKFCQFWKVAKSSKPKRSHPPKLVCMHFRSTSMCRNFLSRFYFLTPMPWSEGKFWPFWRQVKRSQISETDKATPTKIGLHAFHVNLYLPEFFEPILFFDPHGVVHGPKGNFGQFWKQRNLQNRRVHALQNWSIFWSTLIIFHGLLV